MNKRKILYLEDLVKFCEEQKMYSFSSKKTGYKLSVQVPAQFEINTEQNDDSLLFCLVKLMHSGENRNHSSVTDDALIKASKTLAYKPILANFVKYIDPDTSEELVDFTSHDMEITPNGIIYYEGQIGCFTADEPYFEIEEETGHNFLYGYCAIPREYTDATSIIERKNGTKVSVELEINEMQYSAKHKVLELTDINILGATCLGKNPDTLEDVEEGMKNARLDIVDFSQENNSIISYSEENQIINNKLIETLDALNVTLSKFNINQEDLQSSKNYGKEEPESMNDEIKVEEEVTEVETVEEITEEVAEIMEETTEKIKDEVTETEEFTEVVAETETDETVEEDTPEVGEAEESEEIEIVEKSTEEYSSTVKYSVELNGEVKTYEVSLDEKIYAIQDLINITYGESDNTYYGVKVYEDYVIMLDYWSGRAYKQSYSTEEDSYALTGDRIEVYSVWVTAEEEKSLNEMRANYAALEQFKLDTENAQLHTEREAILYNEKYSVLAEKDENNEYKNEAYAKLVSEMDNYSLADLEKELKSVFADYITNGGQFAYTGAPENKSVVNKKLFSIPTSKKPSRYGNLFSNKN